MKVFCPYNHLFLLLIFALFYIYERNANTLVINSQYLSSNWVYNKQYKVLTFHLGGFMKNTRQIILSNEEALVLAKILRNQLDREMKCLEEENSERQFSYAEINALNSKLKSLNLQ